MRELDKIDVAIAMLRRIRLGQVSSFTDSTRTDGPTTGVTVKVNLLRAEDESSDTVSVVAADNLADELVELLKTQKLHIENPATDMYGYSDGFITTMSGARRHGSDGNTIAITIFDNKTICGRDKLAKALEAIIPSERHPSEVRRSTPASPAARR